MYSDVVDLRDFYATSLGQVACRMIRRRIRMIWPDLGGMRLLALGYAVPYLRPFRDEAERIVTVMPALQGVLPWPPDGKNVVALGDEGELPFEDSSIDRVLLVHALECSEEVRLLLKEVWRVLTGSGRVLVVVPNRRGIWARLDRTPFGHGHPYTPGQLSRLLREEMFTPVQSATALYIPPARIAHDAALVAGLGKGRRALVHPLCRGRDDRGGETDLCAADGEAQEAPAAVLRGTAAADRLAPGEFASRVAVNGLSARRGGAPAAHRQKSETFSRR